MLADQPGVTDAEVRALIDAFASRPRPGPSDRLHGRARPRAPVTRGRRSGTPPRGRVGARALFASHPEWVEDVTVPFAAPPDVDRPGTYPFAGRSGRSAPSSARSRARSQTSPPARARPSCSGTT